MNTAQVMVEMRAADSAGAFRTTPAVVGAMLSVWPALPLRAASLKEAMARVFELFGRSGAWAAGEIEVCAPGGAERFIVIDATPDGARLLIDEREVTVAEAQRALVDRFGRAAGAKACETAAAPVASAEAGALIERTRRRKAA